MNVNLDNCTCKKPIEIKICVEKVLYRIHYALNHDKF